MADEPSCYSLTVNDWICGQYWSDRADTLVEQTQQHIYLTVVSVAIGFLLAVPMAVVARRFRTTEPWILGTATVIYTIPSLAMFSLLLPIWNISITTVIVGLVLYSLTILVRNVLAGLDSVPDEVIESALGMGYGPGRLLLKVELPLAMPAIIAGLRIATVSTVALATVGAILGYGGLGNLLATGVAEQFKAQIFAASVLCVALAIVFDLLLLLVGRLLTPWQRGRA